MKISVVIPLYNACSTIGMALSSVAAQRRMPDEVLVVDDGSSDGGGDVARDFLDRLPNLRVIAQANAGVSAARNRGIAEAGHDWIAFLDADDLWLPGLLEVLAAAERNAPTAVLVGADYAQAADAETRAAALANAETGDEAGRTPPVLIDYLARVAVGRAPFCASSVMVNRSALDAAGGFARDEPQGEDIALWARIAVAGPIAVSPYVGAVYRRSDAGTASRQVPRVPSHAITTYLALAAHPELAPDRARLLKEAAARHAIAKALSALAAGRADLARGTFLPIAEETHLNRRLYRRARLLAGLPGPIAAGALAARRWLGGAA